MIRKLSLLIFLLILLTACQISTPPEEVALTYVALTEAAITPSATATNTATKTLTPTNTATSTETPTPTNTSTPIPTLTPTPVVFAVVLENNTEILGGPADGYTFIAIVSEGFQLNVIGQSEDGNWLIVEFPEGVTGWVSKDRVKFDFETESLLVYEVPTKPAPTMTLAPVPEIKVFTDDGVYFRVMGIEYPQEGYYIKIFHLESGESYIFDPEATRVIHRGSAGPNRYHLRRTHGFGTYVITLYNAEDSLIAQASHTFVEKE